MVCFDKMRFDGYFDMSVYVNGKLKKETVYAGLVARKSKYAVLYREPYPKTEFILSMWQSKIVEQGDTDISAERELSYEEAQAIVYWVYQCIKNASEREEFTRNVFDQIEELKDIRKKITFADRAVLYDKSRVDLYLFSSLGKLNEFVAGLGSGSDKLFFRGHADPNYMLMPSVMRTVGLRLNESKLYHELLINCPNDFEKCNTHLEKLVKMQHYGLPTRLLDITRNLLVALFFACEGGTGTYGELVLISANQENIKYPQSDTVSILASLPVFSQKKQRELCRLAQDRYVTDEAFNASAARLIHEIRLEKPAFAAEIHKEDILNSYVVYALKNNNRIVKQDGAFILCGLACEKEGLERFRYTDHGKKVVVLIKDKGKILKQLETFSINRASLFPEIECVAEYFKNKYR